MSIKKSLVFCAALGLAVSANAATHRTSAQHQSPDAVSSQVLTTVNINSADQAALEGVKGLGPKKAQAIIAYREANGSFKSIEDLTKVKGIGKKRLAKISKYLTV